MSGDFDAAYADYAVSLRMALRLAEPGRRRIWDRAALEAQDDFDRVWDRASRSLPPLGHCGALQLTSRWGAFLLHDVAHQAVWP